MRMTDTHRTIPVLSTLFQFVASGIAGLLVVAVAIRIPFLNWIVDAPGSLVSFFLRIDFHEGDCAFGFFLSLFLGWLLATAATWSFVRALYRVSRKGRRGITKLKRE